MDTHEIARESTVAGSIRCDEAFLFHDRPFRCHEEYRFFPHAGTRMYGVLYYPGEISRHRGIVMCAPYIEEHMDSQGFMVNFARFLASRGYVVLRFDYRGCGESGGDWENFSVSEYLADISRALEFLASETGVLNPGVLGVRLGATLAAMSVAGDGPASFAVLCDPVTRGESYIRDLLRLNLAEQLRQQLKVTAGARELLRIIRSGEEVYIAGFPFNTKHHDTLMAIDFPQTAMALRKPTALFTLRNPFSRGESFHSLFDEIRKNSPASIFRELECPVFWKQTPRIVMRAPAFFESAADWIGSLDFSA